MTDTSVITRAALPPLAARAPRTPINTTVTMLLGVLCLFVAWNIFKWAVSDAAWSTDVAACQNVAGACWAMIAAKGRYILFGSYPYAEQWRPLVALLLFVGATAGSAFPSLWDRRLLFIWVGVMAAFLLLMRGGFAGLPYAPLSIWSGLPLTLVLSAVCSVAALPLGILLALGRRSPIRSVSFFCTAYIEIIRGVPLITVLFMSSIMLPLFIPEGMIIDGPARAMIAIWLFTAAYIAEVVRGGLQSLPTGQYEAAASLGLGYWKTMGLVILPQAIRLVIPPLVNIFIEVFKDTTLVIIVGLFDLLNTTRTSLLDVLYRPYYVEAYLFAGAIYFFFCSYMSRISLTLEGRLKKDRR